jgi:LacI family transcriptional regulator
MGADRHGYRLEEFWLGQPGMDAKRMTQVLATRNIPGLIFAPMPEPEVRVQMDFRGMAAVALGFSIIEPPMHRVSNYQFRSMMLLMNELAALGYQRPGLALPKSLDDRVLHQWLGAFLVAHGNRSRGLVPLFVLPDESWTRDKFQRWLDHRRPDVVIGQQEVLLDWLRQSGRLVPQDIGFVHLDTTPGSALSGICQNGKDIGIAAAESVVGMLHRNERGIPSQPRTVLIDGSWVCGSTVRRVGDRALSDHLAQPPNREVRPGPEAPAPIVTKNWSCITRKAGGSFARSSL